MTRFLATLYSPTDKRGAIGIIDSNRGLVYIQSDELPGSMLSHQIRGIQCKNNRVYLTTTASLRIYKVETEPGLPFFRLEKEIILPEWLLGSKFQANLLGILVLSARNEILVANNNLNTIDQFTLDGTFIRRHFLSDISPSVFSAPNIITSPFNYGHIRSIAETPDGSIWLSIARMNGQDKGCVINFDTGEILLNGLHKPHGLIVTEDSIIIQEGRAEEKDKPKLSAYALDENGGPSTQLIWAREVEGLDKNQVLRGMCHFGGVLYCGVYSAVNSVSQAQVSEKIISYDIESGGQEFNEIPIVGCQEFERAQIFFMATLPDVLEDVEINESLFFNHGVLSNWFSVQQDQTVEKVTEDALNAHVVETVASDGCADIPVITLDMVSLYYRRSAISLFSLKKAHRKPRVFQALKKVSFTIYEGETVGIIGRNGSGKSSISKVITGALSVDQGVLTVSGHVQLLSLGLGFQPKLTGRDNVFINGALLGLSRKMLLEKMPEILEFSEIGEFFDEPVRTYSAGMRSRLGFAIATATRPDILILDEVMSTGDAAFRKKADERMAEMRDQTKTVILISHGASQIRKMCSRVIWLNNGELVMDGVPDTVLSSYNKYCN